MEIGTKRDIVPSESNAYIYTAGSVEELLRRVAARIHDLPHDEGAFQVPGSRELDRLVYSHLFLERAPGLYCTARIESYTPTAQYLWLEFRLGQGFSDVQAWKSYWRVPREQKLERYRALHGRGKQVKVRLGLGRAPASVMTESEREAVLELAKAEGMEDAEDYLWKFWRKGSTPLWRVFYINPDEQTPDDTFAQLAVMLLREDMIPEAEVRMLQKTIVAYLRRFGPCSVGVERWLENAPIATRVLLKVIRGFTMPRYWPEWFGYIKTTAEGVKKEAQREIFSSDNPSQFIDVEQRVYNPFWVAREYAVDVRTVRRWMNKHEYTAVNGRRGLSHEQFAAFKWEYKPKQNRARLRKKADAYGISPENFRQLVYRKKKRDGTPDWEAIEADIDRRSGGVAVEDSLSLEDQIAEHQACRDKAAPGSDEWFDAHDALQRLRQMQQDSDT